jgi:hypothetical protein
MSKDPIPHGDADFDTFQQHFISEVSTKPKYGVPQATIALHQAQQVNGKGDHGPWGALVSGKVNG